MTSQSGQRTQLQSSRVHWQLYHAETPAIVIRFFEQQLQLMATQKFSCRLRYRIFYGDRATGAQNLHVGPDSGYIALSATPGFMLLHNQRSTNGIGILMHSIVKIERCAGIPGISRLIYRHACFHVPTIEEAAQEPRVAISNKDSRYLKRIIPRSKNGT